jgi:hypothetical protein
MSQVILTKADGDACLAKPYRSIELPRGLDLQRDSDFELPPFRATHGILSHRRRHQK